MDLETGEQLAAAEVRRNPFYLPTSSTAAITADRERVVLGAGEGHVVLADDRLREIASVSLDDPAPDQADPTCTPCVVGIGTGHDETIHVGFVSSASVVLDGDLEILGTTTPHPTTFSAGSVFPQVLGDGEALRFAADPEAPWALERLGQPTVPLDYGHKHLVIATALAPARDLVATGTLNGEVILRRAPDFGPEHLLPHPGRIQTLQFLPDDRLLVGSSEVARLWDLATVQPIAEFRGHAGEMIGALGLDDGRIATFGYDGTVKLFTCEACRPIEEIVEIARQRLPRELTVLERRLYLGEAA